MQLDPRLDEAELLARQLAGQHVAFGDAQRGALVRERSTTDRRAQSLRITPVGEQLVTQALALLLQTERELLDALSEGERQILLELLHKVACARPR